MNTTTRFSVLLSTLVLAAAPAMAATPSGVGEFSLQMSPVASSSITRQAVINEALQSNVLDTNSETAPMAEQTLRSTPIRQASQPMTVGSAQPRVFNSEIAM